MSVFGEVLRRQRVPSDSFQFPRARSTQTTNLAPIGSAVPDSSPDTAAQSSQASEKPSAPDPTTPPDLPSKPRSWSPPQYCGGRRARQKSFRKAPRQTKKYPFEDQ